MPTVDFGKWKGVYYRVARSASPGDPDALYNEAHDAVEADSTHELTLTYGQRVNVVGAYVQMMLRRLAIWCDTASLPDDCIISSAQLRLDMRKFTTVGYTPNWDWYLKVRAGEDLNTNIVYNQLANYSRILALGTEIGSKYADDLPLGFQEYWNLSVPVGFINKTGYTIFTSLTSKDEARSKPSDGKVTEEAVCILNSFFRLRVVYSTIVVPTVTANPATNVIQELATLNGLLDGDGGEACDVRFQYGLTSGYGTNTAWQPGIHTGATFEQAIAGLNPNTTYHFRAQATNSAGTANGADRTFTTQAILSRAYALAREEL
ncbi:hypothetical protein ES703_78287 [subsurface metagenome]